MVLSCQRGRLTSSWPPYIFLARGQFDPTSSPPLGGTVHTYIHTYTCSRGTIKKGEPKIIIPFISPYVHGTDH